MVVAGYPIVAVLLVLGKIDFDAEAVKLLAGVPWKHINDNFKRNYEKAVEHVLKEVATKGGDRDAIVRQAESIYWQLAALRLKRRPRKKER